VAIGLWTQGWRALDNLGIGDALRKVQRGGLGSQTANHVASRTPAQPRAHTMMTGCGRPRCG
jgi:hypothetical protein